MSAGARPACSTLTWGWGPADTTLYLPSAPSLLSEALDSRQQSCHLSFLKPEHGREGTDPDWLTSLCQESLGGKCQDAHFMDRETEVQGGEGA